MAGVAFAAATLVGWRRLPLAGRVAGLAAAISSPLVPYALPSSPPSPPPVADPLGTAISNWTLVTKRPTITNITEPSVRGQDFFACIVRVTDSDAFFKDREKSAFASDNPIAIWGCTKREGGWTQFGDFRVADPLAFVTAGKDAIFELSTVAELQKHGQLVEMDAMRKRVNPDGKAKRQLTDGFAITVRSDTPSGTVRHPIQKHEWHQGGAKWGFTNDQVRRLCEGDQVDGLDLHSNPSAHSSGVASSRPTALDLLRQQLLKKYGYIALTELPDGRRRFTAGPHTLEEPYLDSPTWCLGTRILIDETETGEPDDTELKAWFEELAGRTATPAPVAAPAPQPALSAVDAANMRANNFGLLDDHLHIQQMPKLTPPAGYVWGTPVALADMTAPIMWMDPADGKRAVHAHVTRNSTSEELVLVFYEEGGTSTDWKSTPPNGGCFTGRLLIRDYFERYGLSGLTSLVSGKNSLFTLRSDL